MRATKLSYLPLVLVLAVAGGWTYTWLGASKSLPKPNGEYELTAVVPSAEFLGARANVTIAGLKVGRITAVERRDGAARLTLALDNKYGPLPRDSRVAVRLRSVVGENYVEISPGRSSSVLPEGGTLALAQADQYVNVDEILSVLQGPARERARATLNGLADGLDGHGKDANRTIGGLAAIVEDGAPVTGVLAAREEQLARLTDDLGVVTEALGERADQVRQLSRTGRRTAEAIAARDDELRATIERLPRTLTAVRSATETLGSVSRRATPTILSTAELLDAVRPAARRLEGAARAGSTLVRELDRTGPLTAVVGSLGEAAPTLTAALPKLRTVLCEVNPAVRYLSPYSRDLAAVLQNMAYQSNFYDAGGNSARLHLALGPSQLKLLNPETKHALRQALGGALGLLETAYNPFPAPGEAGERATRDSPSSFAHVTKVYPRIKAEC